MSEMTIGEVASQVDVKTSTLRYYESIGLLLPPKRTNGQRRYDEEALKRLSIIQIAKEAGFSLKEIETLLNGFSEDKAPPAIWKKLASKKLPEVEDLISRAQGMKKILEEGLACDCLSLDECVVYLDGRVD